MLDRLALALAFLLTLAPTLARQDLTDSMLEGHRARLLAMAFHTYTHEHDDQMPPDLGAMVPYLTGDLSSASPQVRAEAFRKSLLSRRDQGVPIPDKADDQWIGANSSFAYIGGAGVKSADLSDWGNLAIAHLKLDRGFAVPVSEANPEGVAFAVAFIDSHVEILSRAETERIIAQSTAVFEAFKSGKPLPDAQQIPMDLRTVIRAVRAYAKANQGELPPDLGSVFPFIPSDSKRMATPKQRAGIFLTPEARKNTHIPDEPTPDWVNRNTSWVYLGSAGVQLSALEDPANCQLIHGKLESPMEIKGRAGMTRGIPLASAAGGASIEDEEYVRWSVDSSRRVIAWARTGSPLPDHVNAYRDLRIIAQGIWAYTKEHQGSLPPDLGATLPYILPDAPAKERAFIFVSARTERSMAIPESISPEWVNKHSSYTYLGGAGIDLKLAREAGVQVLIHGSLSEPFEVRSPLPYDAIPFGTSYMYPWMTPLGHAERQAKESKDILDALKAAAK